MAIALVNSLTVSGTAAASTTTNTTSASFTPPAGSIIVVKATTSSTQLTIGTVTGGGLTWTQRAGVVSAAGASVKVWTAVATGAALTATVPYTSDATARIYAWFVEWFSGANLATTPASGTVDKDTTTPWSATLTSTVANSVVTWIGGDYNAVTGTVAYISPAVQSGIFQSPPALNAWCAYQVAATVGTQTFGVTAPTGQATTLAGIELIPAVAVVTKPHSVIINQTVKRASFY